MCAVAVAVAAVAVVIGASAAGSAASVFGVEGPLAIQAIATTIKNNVTTATPPPIARTTMDGPLRTNAESSANGVSTGPADGDGDDDGDGDGDGGAFGGGACP